MNKNEIITNPNRFLIMKKYGLEVICDRNRVVPNDPGADTPCMVNKYKDNKLIACSTYWCAVGEQELLRCDSEGVCKLSEKQIEWLDSLDSEITEFLYKGCGAFLQ